MRFYKINKDGSVKFLKTIATAPQARKAQGTVVASVTTKLALFPNDRMRAWREVRIMELARMLPEATYPELSEMAWGVAPCPLTGKAIKVSDFGTNVHAAIETRLNSIKDTGIDVIEGKLIPYSSYAHGFINYVKENNVEILHTEYAIGCEKLLIAATADFIGKLDGKVALWDFKCRGGKTPLKGRAYDSDCMQLAVTAKMIQEQWNLDYMPRIFTVPVDRDTGETYIKAWRESKAAKELDIFLSFNAFFNKKFSVTENK